MNYNNNVELKNKRERETKTEECRVCPQMRRWDGWFGVVLARKDKCNISKRNSSNKIDAIQFIYNFTVEINFFIEKKRKCSFSILWKWIGTKAVEHGVQWKVVPHITPVSIHFHCKRECDEHPAIPFLFSTERKSYGFPMTMQSVNKLWQNCFHHLLVVWMKLFELSL